jgi:anthranilate synthase component 1
VDDKRIVTNRPLAGTRRRGATPEEDVALEKELLADGKECAEHVMLVDLGRNDVGKVATSGSVKVGGRGRRWWRQCCLAGCALRCLMSVV